MVIVVPAAGEGSRFREAGYKTSKPLLLARGVPMIRRVTDMFATERHVIVCQREDRPLVDKATDYAAMTVPISKITEGAAMTVLCAESQVDDNESVIVVNSDNLILNCIPDFVSDCIVSNCDGALITFEVDSGPWSYAKVKGDRVVQVAEKSRIAPHATAGVYYFRTWRMLRTAICRMVAANDRCNGEYYLAPAYNYMIGAGLDVRNFSMDKSSFVSLGTPDDLERYNNALA